MEILGILYYVGLGGCGLFAMFIFWRLQVKKKFEGSFDEFLTFEKGCLEKRLKRVRLMLFPAFVFFIVLANVTVKYILRLPKSDFSEILGIVIFACLFLPIYFTAESRKKWLSVLDDIRSWIYVFGLEKEKIFHYREMLNASPKDATVMFLMDTIGEELKSFEGKDEKRAKIRRNIIESFQYQFESGKISCPRVRDLADVREIGSIEDALNTLSQLDTLLNKFRKKYGREIRKGVVPVVPEFRLD